MRLFFYILVLPFCVFASDSVEKVYEKHCSKCHIKENITVKETVRRVGTLKAPPFIEVSNRLKEQIIIKSGDEDIHREVVISFIKHYIENPNMMIGMCNPGAFERFGEMPSLKGKLSDKETQAIAEWLYDNYEGEKFE